MRTPHFLSATLSVTDSDFVLCVPRRRAELTATSIDLVVVTFPEAEPITYCMIWHDRAEMDVGIAWVRDGLKAAVGSVSRDKR